MILIKATKKDSKKISKLMLSDLKNPPNQFPQEMIDKLREHASEENIIKEFENPNLIAFLAVKNKDIIGFIVGYKEDKSCIMIHYITAKKEEIKNELFNKFVEECKLKNINKITTDAFEFMDNNSFFKSKGFVLVRKEQLTKNLEMLWYELNLK